MVYVGNASGIFSIHENYYQYWFVFSESFVMNPINTKTNVIEYN